MDKESSPLHRPRREERKLVIKDKERERDGVGVVEEGGERFLARIPAVKKCGQGCRADSGQRNTKRSRCCTVAQLLKMFREPGDIPNGPGQWHLRDITANVSFAMTGYYPWTSEGHIFSISLHFRISSSVSLGESREDKEVTAGLSRMAQWVKGLPYRLESRL